MNFIAIIILCAIAADFTLNLVADGLNLKQLKGELPPAFRDVYDADRYRQSQQYLKINTQFGWITAAFNLLLMLVFWFAKGFPLLDQWVRSFELGPVLSGLVYMGLLLLCKAVLSLPFRVYATFGIEARFGFNTTTWKIYLTDLIKGLLLALHLGRMKDAGTMQAAHISMGKLDNVRMALDVAREARNVLGANGITLEYPVIRHMNNLESVYTYEGTNEIHTLILGQAITGENAFV